PSARCWESITQQLSAVMPATSGIESAVASKGGAVGNKGILLSKTAALSSKAVTIVIASIGLVATIAGIVSVVNSKTDIFSSPSPSPHPIQTIAIDTLAVEDSSADHTTVLYQETPIRKTTSPKQHKEDIFKQTGNSQIQHTSTSMTPLVDRVTSNTTTVSTPSPGHTTMLSPSNTIIQPTSQYKNAPSAPTESQVIKSKNVQSPVQNIPDPVLENLSDDQQIEYHEPIIIEIPNVITPNGDGINDNFVIKGIEQCEKSRLIIKNRNATIVFKSENYENNWNGNDLEEGPYFYQFYYKVNGIDQARNGTLLIKR
ncbi:MAG: gliding motility-associated C-terminal domain-containing protein, partial [Bacteroidales bacterium]